MIRIERLELRGYGRLRGTYDFGPTLTVVTGANESGKSSLHEALGNMMFGFSQDERRRRGGISPKEHRRPWEGGPFGGVMSIVSADGRLLRFDWDFEHDRVEVLDDLTGDLLIREAPQQRADSSIGPAFLGVSRERHRQLGSLFQHSLEPVEPSTTLRQALQSAVEAMGTDELGVSEADALLKALLSSLGVNSSHYGNTPSGRVAQLEAQIASLEQALAQARDGRADLDRLAEQQTERVQARSAIDREVAADRRATLNARAQDLAGKLASAKALQTTSGSLAEETVALPATLAGRVAAGREALMTAREAATMAAEHRTRNHPQLSEAQRALRDAESSRDLLAAYEAIRPDEEAAVREHLHEVERIDAAIAALVPVESPLEASPAPREIPAAMPATGASALPYAAAGALAVIGAVVGGVVHPAGFALLAVAAVVAFIGFARGRATSAEADPTPGQIVARPLSAQGPTLGHVERLRELHERRNTQLLELKALLGSEAASGSIEQAAHRYLAACQSHHAFQSAALEVERARSRERALYEPEQLARQAALNLQDAESALRSLLRQAGVDGQDLDAGIDAFQQLAAADREEQVRVFERLGAAERLDELLAGRTLVELAQEVANAEAALQADLQLHGPLPEVEVHTEASQRRIDARALLDNEIAEIRARRQEREAKVGDPGDLELQLAGARDELDRLKLTAEAVRVARDGLADAARAVHKLVAPHLNAALERSLPRITRGRYREVKVADDLSVRVVVPVTHNVVDVERLSRGTRDQIALVERLELARLLDPTGGGAPLLLDDCFAHTDSYRLQPAIEILVETSANRQVILFTDDPTVVEVASSAVEGVAVLELADPVAQGAEPTSAIARGSEQ